MLKLVPNLHVLLCSATLSFGTNALALDISIGSRGDIYLVGWWTDSGVGITDPPQTSTSTLDFDREWDGNYAWIGAEARADMALRVPGARNILPRAEVPASVQARAVAMVNGAGYRDKDAGCGGIMWTCPGLQSSGQSTARASYALTYIVSPDAPAAAHTTPVPVDVYANWSLRATWEGIVSGGGFSYAQLRLGYGSELGSFSFEARILDGVLTEEFISGGLDDASADMAFESLSASGGRFDPNDEQPIAKPFGISLYPNNSYPIIITANAAAAAWGSKTNNWTAMNSASAFIDPVFRVNPSYAFMDYIDVVWSEGLYHDVEELYNPFVGTPQELIGVALLNAPYNLSQPIPEPSQWALMLAGLGLFRLLAWRRPQKDSGSGISPSAIAR